MYVIKKLRLNKFKAMPVQTARRLYELKGFSKPEAESQMTASDENMQQPLPYGGKKTQLLGLGVEMAEKAAEFAENPSATNPLPNITPREK